MSVWQTPQATRRTSTSPALGSASSISCTDERRPELLQHRGPHPHVSRSSESVRFGRGHLTWAQRHAQARRAHREAEALARRRPRGLPFEVAREHRQRGLALQEREVAARAEARAGAEGQERPGVRGRRPASGRGRSAGDRRGRPTWRVRRRRACPRAARRRPTVVSVIGSTKMIGAVDFSRAASRNTASAKRIASAASALLGRAVGRRAPRRPRRPGAPGPRGSRASRSVAQASVLAVVSSPASSIVKTLPNTSRSL